MRWKAFFYMQQTYCCINGLIRARLTSNFQNQLKENVKTIKESKKAHFCRRSIKYISIEKDEYNELTTSAITLK